MNQNDKQTNKKARANRDPILGQSGTNPIGTGVGATTGEAGVGGDAAERKLPTASELERYFDYTVVDRDHNKVGMIDAVWEDHTGQPAYVGIKTGWLGFGRAHVVPAESLEVSEATRKIKLPYVADTVKAAPAFEHQSEIDPEAERQIAEYYRDYGYRGTAVGENRSSQQGVRTDNEDIRVPLREEEVKIGKREVEIGGVRLRKVIRTETVNKPVELKREEIVVERVPATDRPKSRSDIPFREEEIYVPLRREEAVVDKTAHTTEEVRVGKRRETEHRDISETVRREDVQIEKEGDVDDTGRDTRR